MITIAMTVWYRNEIAIRAPLAVDEDKEIDPLLFKDDEQCQSYLSDMAYAEGLIPARYPMPAIPYDVYLYKDAVWICQEPNRLWVLPK